MEEPVDPEPTVEELEKELGMEPATEPSTQDALIEPEPVDGPVTKDMLQTPAQGLEPSDPTSAIVTREEIE